MAVRDAGHPATGSHQLVLPRRRQGARKHTVPALKHPASGRLDRARVADILCGDEAPGVALRPDGRPDPIAGAVVASGGFEANLDWLGEYWGDAAQNYQVRGTRQNDGTVLRLLLDAGAAACELHSLNPSSLWDGYQGHGVARASVLRGELLMRDGEPVGAPRGAYVPSKTAQ